MACLVTVLFVVWKIFHKNLLDIYYSNAFLFIVIFKTKSYSLPENLDQFSYQNIGFVLALMLLINIYSN